MSTKDLQRFQVDRDLLKSILARVLGEWEFDSSEFGTDVLLLARNDNWHPQTRAEIYLLIWIGKQLSLDLPRNVLETIGKWIQLYDICMDITKGLACVIYVRDQPIQLLHNFNFESWYETTPGLPDTWAKGGWRIELVDIHHFSSLAEKEDELEKQATLALDCPRNDLIDIRRFWAATVLKTIKKYDRYRVVLPSRERLLALHEKLNFV